MMNLQVVRITAIVVLLGVTHASPLLSEIAAPDTVIIAGPTGSLGSSDFAFWWTGKTATPDSYIKGFYYRLDNEPWNWTQDRVIAYYDVPDGSHRLEVKAVDSDNAEDPSPAGRAFTVRSSPAVEPNELPFSVELEFLELESDLDARTILRGLRQEFKNDGILLSKDAGVSVGDSGSRWLITDGNKTYTVRKEGTELNIYDGGALFDIRSRFEDELDDSIISEDLREEFKQEGIIFSPDAIVEIKDKGSRWLITDGNGIYTVRKEANRLNIYEGGLLFRINNSDLTKELDKGIIPQALRDEFEDEGISLSEYAIVEVEEEDSKWLITDGAMTYRVRKEGSSPKVYGYEKLLFDIESIQYIIGNLDSGDIPASLRKRFQDNGVLLLQTATVSFETKGSEWRITNENKIYTVKEKGNNELSIYERVNDDPAEAILLTPGTVINCLSQPDDDDDSGDVDWFRVVADGQSGQSAPRQITVFFKRPDAKDSTTIEIYRYPEVQPNDKIASFDARYRAFFATGIVPGDYMIRVSPGGSEIPAAAYFLTVTTDSLTPEIIWDREPNDKPSDATETPSVFLSKETSWVEMVGNKWLGDDKDYFRIHVDIDQPARLNLNLTPPQDKSTTVRLFPAASMNSKLGEFMLNPYSGLQWKLEAGVRLGDYVLEVDLPTEQDPDFPYFLTLQISDFPSGEVWELEPNDSPGSANRLPVGVRIRATQSHANDSKDHFRVTIPHDGILNLTTSHILLSSGAVKIHSLDPILLSPVGNPLDYEVQEERERDFLNLDVLTGEYLVEVDLTKVAGDYWFAAQLVSSLEHNAPTEIDDPLVVGDVLLVKLVWEPGNTAVFDILEIVDGNEGELLNSEPVPMYDDGLHGDGGRNDGVYIGEYIIESVIEDEVEDADYLRNARVIVHLWDQAGNTADIPMDDTEFTIDMSPPDTTPPEISDVSHDAVIGDAKAPPLSTREKLTVTIIGDAENTATFDIGEMAKGLPAYDDGRGSDTTADDGKYVGIYTVKAEDYINDAMITGYLADEAGNVTSLDALIPVDIVGERPAIISVDHEHRLTLGKDENFEVTLIGDPNGIVSFDIEGLVDDVPMYDRGSYKYGDRDYRKYVGSYEVAEGDGVISASVTAHLVDREGRKSSKIAPLKVNIDAVAPAPVVGVEAYDRPADQGGFLTLSWNASTEIDFAHYNIYLSEEFPAPSGSAGILPASFQPMVSDITNPEQTSVDVEVEADLTDYFAIVTAVDIMGNESVLDKDGGSVAGPVQASDNLKPAPVKTVEAVDRGADFGGMIILSWTDVNQDEDFVRYNIYQEVEPILSTEELRPVDSIADRYVTVVDIPVAVAGRMPALPVDYYFAVTAVDLLGNESELDEFGGSIAGPVRAENNLGVEPDVPVRFLSGPLSTVHHDHVAFHWGRFKFTPLERNNPLTPPLKRGMGGFSGRPYTGYYFRLDNANWQWTTASTAVYHSLREGQHTFSVRPGGQAEGTSVPEQTTISRSFTVVPVSTSEQEPNDSQNLANTIRAGMIIRGDNSDGSDGDWFRIHVPIVGMSVMSVLFSRPSGTGSTTVSIYADQPFQEIGRFVSSDGQPGHFALGVAPESDYLVHVGSAGDSTQYRLVVTIDSLPAGFIWEIEDNDRGDSATDLDVGTLLAEQGGGKPLPYEASRVEHAASLFEIEVWGSSDGDQDQDWFRVHIPVTSDQSSVISDHSTWMSISFHRPDIEAVTNVGIYSSYPDVEDRQIGGFSVGADLTPPRPLAPSLPRFTGVVARGSDYFIKVDNGDEPTFSAYHFLLSVAEISADEGTVWEIEPNNLAAWANPMDIGVKQRGTNWDGNEDDDWYILDTRPWMLDTRNQHSLLSLHFSRPLGIGTTLVELYDAAESLLQTMEVDVGSTQRGSINVNVKAGTYYVKVHPQNESPSAEYELTALLIESFSVTRFSADGEEIEREGRPLKAGDVVALELIWRGEKATFDIGDISTDLPMVEQGDGVYKGTYTVVNGDDEINAPIVVHLEDQFGNAADIELDEAVTVDTAPPEISEVSHDGITPLNAGKNLTVRMVGEPGGRARFDIVGFKTGLDMYNMTSGVAEPPLVILSWDWRPDPSFWGSDGAIIVVGEVKNVSDSVKNSVRVNVTFYDVNGEVVDTDFTYTTPRDIPPGVVASFRIFADYLGTEESAKLQLVYGLDDTVVGETADEGVYIGAYEVGDNDNISNASIICYLTDAAGNRSTAKAEERVSFDTIPPIIKSLTHDANKVLVEGDILTVTLEVEHAASLFEGEPGGEATFDIGDFQTGLKMSSVDPDDGRYVGTYRVKPGDEVMGALITGHLKDAAGNEATYIGMRTVSINTSAPVISVVAHNAMNRPFIEGETLTVTVNTEPGARAVFDVENLVYDRPMYDDGEHDDGEPNDGVYKGSYIIRRGDNVRDGRVKVTVTGPNGKSVLREAIEAVSVDTDPPVAVTGVYVMDRPDDEGGYVVLSWTPSDVEDFHHYNIYQSEQPIISLRELEPIDVLDAGCWMLDAGCSTVEIPVLAPSPSRPLAPTYYFAVTAVDNSTNESLLTRESTDGPASGIDNLPPPPVEKVSGYDRAYDNGKVITIVWSDPSTAEDFYRYHIYMDTVPIVEHAASLFENGSMGQWVNGSIDLPPVDASITDRNVLTIDIVVPEDGVDFFFAVTAADTSGNESQITGDSVVGPISSEDNLGVAPDTLVKIISGPVGEIHHDDVTFRWNRWFSRVESRIRPEGGRTQGSPLPGYYYKLDDGNWVWTNEIYKTYYDLKEGKHTFYVRADLGADGIDPMPAIRVFAVKRISISEMEPNNSSGRANWISKGMTVVGTNADDGDDDWYRFHVEADRLMTLHFDRIGGISTTSVTVFRSFPPTQETSVGTFIATPAAQRQSFSTGVKLGDYFVLVDSHGEDPDARYEISVMTNEILGDVQWDTENNDQPRMAQNISDFGFSISDSPSSPINNTVEVSGFGNKDGDVDWYRLQISGLEQASPSSVFMDFDFVRPQGAGSTEMSIYAAFPHDLQAPKVGLVTLLPTNNQRQKASTLLREGDYFLKVDSSQEIDISSIYSFRISFAATSEKWEVEPNGVLQFANLLSVDEVMKGTSWHPDDDVDWYRVRLDRRGIFVLSYFKPFGTGSAEIKLKSADATDIANASASVLTGQKATIGIGLNLGNYLVAVDPEGEEDASAEYQLVATAIESIELLAPTPPHPRTPSPSSGVLGLGASLSLTVVWDPGNTLSFDIGKLRTELPMYDDGAHDDADAHDGIYVGMYTVQAGDDISDGEIILHLGMPPGGDAANPPVPVSPRPGVSTWVADIQLTDRVTIDTTPPEVSKVDHDMRLRPLLSGDVLNVTMIGEAGARDAFFDIILPAGANLVSARSSSLRRYLENPMEESPAGTYSGSYTVEEGDDLEAAFVVCHLIDEAGNESLKSIDLPISLDTTPPEIIGIEHDVKAILVEGDTLTITVASDTINGKAAFSIEGLVTNRPMYDDSTHGDSATDDGIYTGRYTVRRGDNITDTLISVRLIDEAGNVSEESAFDPLSIDTTPPEIASFIHDASDILSEDDVLTVTLTGDPGNFATFDMGDTAQASAFRSGLPMYDDGTRSDETPNDGVYVGTYTVKKGDSAKDMRITGYLTDKNGNQMVYRVFERVSIDAVPPEPVINVQAADKPDDQGYWITLTWEAPAQASPSSAEDFDHYNIYRESAPIISVLGLTPLSDNGAAGERLSLRLTDHMDVIVPANGVDYYLAVTISDHAGNESPLASSSQASPSVAGPVQALDNLAPDPVTVVSAIDRPDDQGKTIIVSWTKVSTAQDFDHYGIYVSDDPVVSLKDLEPVLDVKASDTILVTHHPSPITRHGSYVTVPSDGVDFYFAVTTFDENGNESALDDQGGSVAGPVRSSDDTPPQPVIVFDVVDTPHDDGGSLDVQWQPNTDEEIRDYSFYLSRQPIDNQMIQTLQPVEVVDASTITVSPSAYEPMSPSAYYQLRFSVDLTSSYVAVTAIDFGGNSSALDEFGRSVAGPVQSVSNTVKAGSDTSIFAGFDRGTWVLIPAGAIGHRETVDILWPTESIQQRIEEADRFLERSHIDPPIDPYFADTVREFRASTVNIVHPVRITLSYPDITEMQNVVGLIPSFSSQSATRHGFTPALSQDEERQFRIFKLNQKSRIPRWELVPGPQKVDTSQNTVSVQIRTLGVYRVARLRLPANLDRVVVYPNPFIPSQSINGYITFKNLTENITIQIYNMVGERVRTIQKVGGGDEAIWDVRNDRGEEAASGTYVYQIQSEEDTYMGKIIILR